MLDSNQNIINNIIWIPLLRMLIVSRNESLWQYKSHVIIYWNNLVPFWRVTFLLLYMQVWASKWNERAYFSCKKAKLNHEDLRMAVLVQAVICGDYAFVIHTKNPLSGDTSEIYAEVSLPFWFYVYLVISGAFFIYVLGLKTDCERFGRDIGGCISRTRYELHCEKEQPSYRKAFFFLLHLLSADTCPM